ncbi:MAG: 6-bladed beta-propeller [Rikenellaceae bacterium]
MKRLTMFLASALLFVQCQDADLSTVEPLKFKNVKSTKAMSKVVEQMHVVELEFPESELQLGQVNKVIKTRDGGFAISFNHANRVVYLFAADGSFVKDITAEGYLDGEKHAVADLATDYATNELFVMDALNKVLVYDATTGAFLRRIKPQWEDRTYRLDGFAPNGVDGGFSVVSSNTATRRDSTMRTVVTAFDSQGRQTDEYVQTDDYMFDNSLVLQVADNGYVLRPVDSRNDIYEFVDGVPTELYKVDFGRLTSPAHMLYNSRGVVKFIPYFTNEYYKFVNSVTLTPHTMSFVASGPDGASAHYVYDRLSGNGIRFAAKDGTTFPSPFVLSDNDFHYVVYDKRSRTDMEERADVLIQYITEKEGLLTPTGGYKLVGVKFRAL